MRIKAKIKLNGRFDNTEGCTVTIEPTGQGDFFVCVRPSRCRRRYRWLLSEVARGVIIKAAMAGTVS